MTVAFFGHKDAPDTVRPLIEQVVDGMISENGTAVFYVGTHGAFDRMVQGVLTKAAATHPSISCNIVLAYYDPTDNSVRYDLPTVYPEGIEAVPKRFAIEYRNNFMVRECDTVVCYITREWGGAYKFTEKAQKQGKNIINLASI